MKLANSFLRSLRPTLFNIVYHSAHLPPKRPDDLADNPPLHTTYLRRYATRDRSGLWLFLCSNSKSLSRYAVVRNWCTRRLRVAFQDELVKQGFDREGRWVGASLRKNVSLSPDGSACEASSEGSVRMRNITGTLRLYLLPRLVTATGAEVRSQAAAVADALVRAAKAESSRSQAGAPPGARPQSSSPASMSRARKGPGDETPGLRGSSQKRRASRPARQYDRPSDLAK